MATAAIFVPSSSPSFAGCHVTAMSSSPVFPSPSALLQKGSPLKSGSRTASIPKSATNSFTGAGDILRDQRPAKATTATGDPFTENRAKIKTSRKLRINKECEVSAELTVRKPQKPRAKKVEVGAPDTTTVAEKPGRRPTAREDATETQAKIPKYRITKGPLGFQAEKYTVERRTKGVSGYFTSAAGDKAEPSHTTKGSENDLLLQETVKRRRSWTPPRESADPLGIDINPSKNGVGAPALPSASGSKQKAIADFFGNFGYNVNGDNATPERTMHQPGLWKRKLMELVEIRALAPESAESMFKSVNKKRRTITNMAVSMYAVDSNEDLDPLPAPLLDYLSYNNVQPRTIGGNTDGLEVPPKSHSRSPVRISSKVSKSRKWRVEAPMFLSPETAFKKVETQRFVFGTSSQLAQEDSPTLLRNPQQGIQASNQVEHDPFSDFGALSLSKSSLAVESGTGLYIAKRNLWAEASRGLENRLVDVETLDLSESPQVLASAKPSAQVSNGSEVAARLKLKPANDGRHDLKDDPTHLVEKSKILAQPSSRTGPWAAVIESEPLSCPVRVDAAVRPSLSKGNTVAPRPARKVGRPSKQPSATQKPDYGSYTTIQLSKEIASYKFKPLKSREKMIDLLERCWEEKQKSTFGSQLNSGLTTSSPVKSTSESNKPLILQQTPKKQRKKATSILERISGSDKPLTPSPPRRRTTQARTPPLQLPASTDPDESLVLSPTSQQLHLHKQITHAIMSAPRSMDPKNPSWHEKILLYDPIVLEDLATWLNTGALQKVGWDGEVSAFEVKRWCLEKSICCLWRENLRGVARSRY